MLSSTHIIKRQTQQKSSRVFSLAASQLRFASHSAKSNATISRLITEKKQNDQIKNVPLNLLPLSHSSSSSNPNINSYKSPSLSSLNSNSSLMDGSVSDRAKILANSNDNNDNSPPSNNSPETPTKSKRERKKNDDSASEKSKDEKTPSQDKESTESDSTSTTKDFKSDKPSSKSSKSSKNSSTNNNNSNEKPSSSSAGTPSSPSPGPGNTVQSQSRPLNATDPSRTNNTDILFTAASASNKKQVLVLPINRRPLIPGKFLLLFYSY